MENKTKLSVQDADGKWHDVTEIRDLKVAPGKGEVKLVFKSQKARDKHNGRMGLDANQKVKPGTGNRDRTAVEAAKIERRRKANKKARAQRKYNARRKAS